MAKPIVIEQIDKLRNITSVQPTETAVTHTASTAAGSATQPVYVDASGVATATTCTLEASVPSGAKFTDTVTTVASTTGTGNAVTEITASNGALTVTKGTTFLTSHQDITGKQDKLAVTGSATKPVYVSAAGTVSACSYELNKTVPSDAVFTDTTYSAVSSSAAGLAPKLGTAGQVLKVNSGATAAEWGEAGGASSVAVTLTTSWTGSAAPYTQAVAVSGMTATTVGTFGLATTADASAYAAAAEAQLLVTSQGTDTITVTAFGTKPTVAIPCVVNITK